VGGKCPRYGWQWHDPVLKDYLVLNEDQAEVLRWAAEEYARGIPCLTLVKQLNAQGIASPSGECEWTPRTLRRMLEDKRNTGTDAQMFINPKKEAKRNLEPVDLPDGTYPQIFSMELYEQVVARAAVNKEESARNGQNPENYLLRAGFIRCADCNHAMVGIIKRDRRRDHEQLGYMCQPTKDCPGHYVPSVRLDTEVWAEMVKLADHVSLIEEAIQVATKTDTIAANLRAVEAAIGEYQQLADNYTGDLQDKSLRGTTRAAILKLLDDANAVIERLEAERRQILAGAYDKERERQAYADILVWCKKVKAVREELDYTQKRDFLRMLGVVVLVKKVNRNFEEMSYDIRVQLPSIQEIIHQNGTFVGQSLMRRP
jgi:site-specific DNA recombinase